MDLIFPSSLLSRIYLSPKGVPLFRHNAHMPRAVWGKPVPAYGLGGAGGDQVWYFVSYQYAVPGFAIEALRAYVAEGNALPPADTPERADVFNEMVYLPVFEALGNDLQAMASGPYAVKSNVLLGIRKRAIRSSAERMMGKLGLPADAPVPKEAIGVLAMMYDVSETVIVKSLGAPEVAPVPKARTDYKDDERWKHVVRMTMLARTHSYQLWLRSPVGTPKLAGKFSAADALMRYEGELIYPERCPVTGEVLIYDAYVNKKDPRMAKVGRIDIRSPGGETLPYESGNVTLMSALGLKVTEGRVPISKLTEDQHAHWLRWAEAHKTDTTPPSTATATPDDTNVTTTKTDELEDAIDERNA
jgi:hypothetical protein